MNRGLALLLGTTVALGFALPAAAQRVSVPRGLPASAALLLRYDANHDGKVTRAELEAGLKADYARADTNHDGCIDPAEMRAENDRRLSRDGDQATPLKDWNLDGCVDMAEFAGAARSYFNFVDRNKDNLVTTAELRGPSMPLPVPKETYGQKAQQRAEKQAQTEATPDQSVIPGVSF